MAEYALIWLHIFFREGGGRGFVRAHKCFRECSHHVPEVISHVPNDVPQVPNVSPKSTTGLPLQKSNTFLPTNPELVFNE
jgi:hypothetical protein